MSEFIPGVPLPLLGRTRVYAILGDPIDQVGSPTLFNTAFSRCGIEAVLVPMHVPAASLGTIIAAFRAVDNFDGLIITVPHKFAAAALVDELGPNARVTGAVNTIKKLPDGRLFGENFDGEGFMRGLATQGHSVAGQRVLLIGAGGAGCAVGHAIAAAGAIALGIVDTDVARRDALIDSIKAVSELSNVFAAEAAARGFDIVVNCTSVGMHPGDPLPLDMRNVEKGALFVDIILQPVRTPMLIAAASLGCDTHPGPNMLEGQVDSVIEFFFGSGRVAAPARPLR